MLCSLIAFCSRNVAVKAAPSEYVMQWDDDDLYHPDRIAEQLRALQNAAGESRYSTQKVVGQHWISVGKQKASSRVRCSFLSGWVNRMERSGQLHLQHLPQEGTILAERALLLDCYPDNVTRLSVGGKIIGEDTICIRKLFSSGELHCSVLDAPWLYVYNLHSGQTVDVEHQSVILRSSRNLGARADLPAAVKSGSAKMLTAAWAPFWTRVRRAVVKWASWRARDGT